MCGVPAGAVSVVTAHGGYFPRLPLIPLRLTRFCHR
uniref:Uncharacterized protein n=1 Tax=Anguilla anguilla TaxID=7936 RepID=A0A0E9QNY2_ANGAN